MLGKWYPFYLALSFYFDKAMASRAQGPVFSEPSSKWEATSVVPQLPLSLSPISTAGSSLTGVREGKRTDWAQPIKPISTEPHL